MPDYVWKALLVLIGVLLVAEIGAVVGKVRSGFLRFILHGAAGLASLITANTVAAVFGAAVALNAVSFTVAALLGVPGVGLLYALRLAVLGT